jgi:hypothetical protein
MLKPHSLLSAAGPKVQWKAFARPVPPCPARANRQAYNEDFCKELWEVSAELAKVPAQTAN